MRTITVTILLAGRNGPRAGVGEVDAERYNRTLGRGASLPIIGGRS